MSYGYPTSRSRSFAARSLDFSAFVQRKWLRRLSAEEPFDMAQNVRLLGTFRVAALAWAVAFSFHG